jgi:YD repeat-containing protein
MQRGQLHNHVCYGVLNRALSVRDARNHVSTTTYDAQDNELVVIDPSGNATTMLYDALNRMVLSCSPSSGTTHLVYDAGSRLIDISDGTGTDRVPTYDALNRETGGTWLLGGVTTVNLLTYAYDAASNLLQAADFNSADVRAIGPKVGLCRPGTVSRTWHFLGKGPSGQRLNPLCRALAACGQASFLAPPLASHLPAWPPGR